MDIRITGSLKRKGRNNLVTLCQLRQGLRLLYYVKGEERWGAIELRGVVQ